MKKVFQVSMLALALLTIAHTAFGQKKIKEGMVRFELDMSEAGNSPEMAMLGGTSLEFYFTDSKQKMDMNMMGGMMRIQTIVPIDNPKDGIILMDMMGQKIQIVDLTEDDLSQSNNFMNMDEVKEVTYNEKDTKEIAGYKCYKAKLIMNNGMQMNYYITEKIQPPTGLKNKNATVLKGYPLEMKIDTGEGITMTFVAKEVSDSVSKDVFTVEEGYNKMTMEEFEKQMGGAGLNGFGN